MDDSDYLPLSWLSQVDYCPRRASLLLNERIWVENADTAKGRYEHSRVHDSRVERRGDALKLYEYTVFSNALGVLGKCDCIEARRCEGGCTIRAADFPVSLYPVEYKHGSVREERSYMIQLCAQAMCLEEMLSTSIPCGALFSYQLIDAWRLSFRSLSVRTSESGQSSCGSCGRSILFRRQNTAPI